MKFKHLMRALHLFNRSINTPQYYRLELIAVGLPKAIRLLAWFLTFLGPLWLLASFLTSTPSLLLRSGIFGGLIVLFIGRVVAIVADIMDAINTVFIFDFSQKMLRIEYSPKRAYAFLPKQLAFDDIEKLQLKVVRSDKPGPAPWMLEFILTDGKFIPFTACKTEARARQILQDLKLPLSKPTTEVHVGSHSFREYKKAFLAQFEAGD